MQPSSPPEPPHALPIPRAVLFDLDGTLVDSLGDLVLATDATLQALGHPPAGTARVRTWVGRGIDALVQEALTWAGHEGSPGSGSEHALAVFAEHYAAANGRTTRALAGADALLHWLDGHRELRVGLVTNKSRRFALELLDGLAWRKYFHAVVCGDDVTEKKPAAQPVRQALAQLEVSAGEAVMVGDSTYDVLAAQAAGVPAIRLAEGYGPPRDGDAPTAEWEGATIGAVLHWLRGA